MNRWRHELTEVEYHCINCGSEISPSDTVCSKCGKSTTLRTVNKTISFTFDSILVRSPQKYLSDMLSQDRLLEGTVVAVMFFERYGSEMLKNYFKSKGILLEPLGIDKWQVSKIMNALVGFGLIDTGAHGRICEVIDERNDIVHKLDNPDSINKRKLKQIIEKAIGCLKVLGAP